MGWKVAADTVLVVHAGFIVFIVLGGLVARRRPALRRVHLAAVAYGAIIAVAGFRCPLTPLEKSLRASAGEAGYEGGFIEHHLLRLIYPGGLDSLARTAMVAIVVLATVVAYGPLPARAARRSA